MTAGQIVSYDLPAGPRLNLGCGPVQPKGWVNIDGSNRAWLAGKLSSVDRFLTWLHVLPPTEFGPNVVVHDLHKRLPYADGEVAAIYAGELFEHFEYAGAVALGRECFRVLRPGGVLRVCVPDGPAFWENYIELYEEMKAKPRSEWSAQALRDVVQLYFNEICTKRVWLRSMGHKHKWQFDEVQLIDLFVSAGFSEVDRMPFRASRIPGIAGVERSNFLIVEGVKPA